LPSSNGLDSFTLWGHPPPPPHALVFFATFTFFAVNVAMRSYFLALCAASIWNRQELAGVPLVGALLNGYSSLMRAFLLRLGRVIGVPQQRRMACRVLLRLAVQLQSFTPPPTSSLSYASGTQSASSEQYFKGNLEPLYELTQTHAFSLSITLVTGSSPGVGEARACVAADEEPASTPVVTIPVGSGLCQKDRLVLRGSKPIFSDISPSKQYSCGGVGQNSIWASLTRRRQRAIIRFSDANSHHED